MSPLERYAPRAPSAEPAWRASKAHWSLGRLAAFLIGRDGAWESRGNVLPRLERGTSGKSNKAHKSRLDCAYEPWWLRILAFMGERYERFLFETAHLRGFRSRRSHMMRKLFKYGGIIASITLINRRGCRRNRCRRARRNAGAKRAYGREDRRVAGHDSGRDQSRGEGRRSRSRNAHHP